MLAASAANVIDGLGECPAPPDPQGVLDDFVAAHSGVKQRDADWYSSMATTVGGSELAAIMGMNPYSSLRDVVASKVAALQGGSTWNGGGEACWWGVLFEDVVAAFVALDLGRPVSGDEICIQQYPGHRNSPDGYVVAKMRRAPYGGGDRLVLATTAAAEAAGNEERVLLLEIKCPISRKPTGRIPQHYRPQLWSGLMVSPVAHLGLFVDAVLRKCSLDLLGDTPDYDTEYHAKDRLKTWDLPVAWGIIGVYAPALDAPRKVRYGWLGDEWAKGDPSPENPDADAAHAAWDIKSEHLGSKDAAIGRPDDEVVDLGAVPPATFNRALKLVNNGLFRVARLPPCFADGRRAGSAMHGAAAILARLADLRRGAAPDWYLMGIIPWKLMQIDYVPAERRPGFIDEIRPLIDNVHTIAVEATQSPDPNDFLRRRFAPGPAVLSHISETDLQDLFDAIKK